MRRASLALAVVALAATAPALEAEMCALDAVPAATLLLPYFEVDLDAEPGTGVNTIFIVHNALPSPAVAHVTIWTDWSQPVLDFDLFLTGYDVQTISLYYILVDGNLPVTADEQSDQGQDGGRVDDPTSLCDGTVDSCSPHGSHPEWDGSFDGEGISVPGAADCLDIFPFMVNPLLVGLRLAEVQAKLTGQPIDGAYFGADHGDNVARGYVTVDNANTCSLILPPDPGYFSDGVSPGVASDVNQLWGDWVQVDPQNLWAWAIDPLIHIEADADFDASSTPTNYTFYGRYTQATGGLDHREPLGSAWGFSYYQGFFDLADDLIVWRDSTADNQNPAGYGPSGPDWLPLDHTQVVCFNQTEDAVEICSDVACFPLETQRLAFGTGDLDVPDTVGWCYLNLNIPGDAVTGDVDFPAFPPGDVAQSWVGVTHQTGVITGGLHSVLWSHACEDVNPVIEPVAGTEERAEP